MIFGRKINLEISVVVILILLYTIAASLVSVNRFWQYNAFWYDLGIFDTTIWKLSRFQLPNIAQLNPPYGRIVWADHFNPSSILLAPLYWITARQEIILIAQAVSVGLSAIVAYLISIKHVKDKIVRFSLLISYLGFVGLQNALYTDVHNLVFSLLPFMLTVWAIYENKWKWYWVFLIITMGFQENMAAFTVMLGLFLILRKDRNIQTGLLTIATGLLYGILAMKVIIPFFNGGNYTYKPDYPATWYEWFTRFVFPLNIKFRTIFLTFATFGFLPVWALSVFPIVIEHYLERFVLNPAGTRWDLGFHYNALLSPVMFLASVEMILRIQKNKILKRFQPYWATGTILIVIFLHRFYLHGPLMLATHPVFYNQTRDAKFLDYFVSQIPRKGLLMTQNNIAPFFTHGETVLLHKDFEKIRPDTIAIDIREGQNANNFFPMRQENVSDFVASVSASALYQKREITDSQLIFTRK